MAGVSQAPSLVRALALPLELPPPEVLLSKTLERGGRFTKFPLALLHARDEDLPFRLPTLLRVAELPLELHLG